MRGYGFSAIITAGALWLGVTSLHRGQYWLGVCFIGIGLLRLGTVLWRKKASHKPRPSIRLNIEEASVPESLHKSSSGESQKHEL